jgi:GTPase SAR1 family protein
MLDEVKVVVIGSVGVGKSSLTTRFIFNEFNDNMATTLGAAYF